MALGTLEVLWKPISKALSQPQRKLLMSSILSLPRASALADLFIQTWKDGDLKGKSSLTKISAGSSAMGRQPSPGFLYPNGN